MAKRKGMQTVATLPGAANLRDLAVGFLQKGGWATSLSEDVMRLLPEWVGDGDPDREVLSFRAALSNLARLSGMEPVRIATSRIELEAVAQACLEQAPDSPFYRGRFHPGTHRLLARSLNELEQALFPWDVPLPPELPLGTWTRLDALANLRKEVDHRLAQIQCQRFAVHARELLRTDPEPLAQDIRILIFAFGEFTPLRARLIQWMSECVSVCAVLERPAAGQDLFGDSRAYAEAWGAEPELHGRPIGLAESMFAPAGGLAGDVRAEVWRYPNDLYEAEWTLRLAQEAIESGVPAARIVLFSREPDRTLPLLEAAGKRLGIEVATHRRTPLMGNSLIRLLLDVMEAMARNDPKPVAAFSRVSYLRTSVETRNALQAAALQAAASGEGWKAMPPADLAEKLPWLARMREWWDKNAHETQAALDWSERLADLAAIIEDHEEDFHEGPTAERDRRAVERARQEIFTWLSVSRNTRGPLSLQEFAKRCRELWASAETTPPAPDRGIRVASSAQGVGEVDLLFGLGMVEGRFPRSRREDGVLGDLDRDAIQEYLSASLERSKTSASRERDEFYRVASSAPHLVLSYPASSSDDREQTKAYYLQQVSGAVERTRQRSEVVPVPEEIRLASDRRLAEALAQEGALTSPTGFEDRAAAELRFPPPKVQDIRELRDAVTCGFRQFVEHRLDVEPMRSPTRWASLIRLPAKAGLHRAETPEMAALALELELSNLLETLRYGSPEWELKLIEAGGRILIGQWVEREFVARKVWPRKLEQDGYWAKGSIAARSDALLRAENGRALLRHSRVAPLPKKELSDAVWLEYAARLLEVRRTLDDPRPVLMELETMGEVRQLVCAYLPQGWPTPVGLQAVELCPDAPDEAAAWEAMRRKAGSELMEAKRIASELHVVPKPGPACRSCDYGELCRRSQEFTEEASPFDA